MIETDLTAARELLSMAERTPGCSRLASEVAEVLSSGAGKLRYTEDESLLSHAARSIFRECETLPEGTLKARPGSVWLDHNGYLKLLKGSFEISGNARGAAYGTTSVGVSNSAVLDAFDRTQIEANEGTGRIAAHDTAAILLNDEKPVRVSLEDRSNAHLNLWSKASRNRIDDLRIYPQEVGKVWIPTSTNEAPWIMSKTAHAQDSPLARIYETARKATVRLGEFESDDGESCGSGFLISPAGHIATADHVVEGYGGKLPVEAIGKIFEAEVIASDPEADIAVLKVMTDKESFPSVKLAQSSYLPLGRQTVMTGYPSSTGMLHAYPGTLVDAPVREYRAMKLYTNANSHKGASGGFLMDQTTGEVIGINRAMRNVSEGMTWNSQEQAEFGPSGLRNVHPIRGIATRVEHLHSLLRKAGI